MPIPTPSLPDIRLLLMPFSHASCLPSSAYPPMPHLLSLVPPLFSSLGTGGGGKPVQRAAAVVCLLQDTSSSWAQGVTLCPVGWEEGAVCMPSYTTSYSLGYIPEEDRRQTKAGVLNNARQACVHHQHALPAAAAAM